MGLAKFYKGRRVLITGNTGFKGSWLSLILQEYGAEVYGYSLSPEKELNNYNVSYKGDFLSSDPNSRNFYWQNFFNSLNDRDNFYLNWLGGDDSVEIKDLFSEQSECFSSNSYIGYRVY